MRKAVGTEGVELALSSRNNVKEDNVTRPKKSDTTKDVVEVLSAPQSMQAAENKKNLENAMVRYIVVLLSFVVTYLAYIC